jgi:serine protease Do
LILKEKMNMNWSSSNQGKKHIRWVRAFLVPALALVLGGSLAAYKFSTPSSATAAMAAPAAAPLDAESVSPLIALNHAMEALAAHVTPAVVNVTVTSREKESAQMPEGMEQFFGQFFGQQFGDQDGQGGPHMRPQSRIEHGLGSGVIISPDGYIVTNNHVVEGAVDIRVSTNDRRLFNAKLVGTDPLTDIAVLKVEGKNLPSVPWGDSTQLHPGETVLAFGNPYNQNFTVTRGIVSALNRPNPDMSDRRKPGEFIQTDAAINPGNSGGPLVDVRGEVVGINTFLISPSGTFTGMGFAIPTQIAKPTVDTLIRYGKVSHGYMGIGITDVTPDNARFFKLNSNEGAVVTEVQPNTPGAKAGLKSGDVITAIDGQKISDAGKLQILVGEKQPNTRIELSVLRDGKDMTVPVTLEDMQHSSPGASENAGAEQGKPRWGIGLQDLTPDLRQELQAPEDVHGAVITDVKPGSAADIAGLQRGDIILEVNRQKVSNASDVQKALSGLPNGQDVMLLVRSNGGNAFIVMHPTEGQ